MPRKPIDLNANELSFWHLAGENHPAGLPSGERVFGVIFLAHRLENHFASEGYQPFPQACSLLYCNL